MQNSQGNFFIWTYTYRQIFKYALVYLLSLMFILPKSGWRKYVTFFEILVFFNSGKQVLFLRKVLAKNYKGKFFPREACAIKFPLWKQYCNWKSEYGKYVFNICPLSRFTLACFYYPDFGILLLPFSRLYYGTYFLFPELKYQLICALTCNLYILPI